MANVRITVVIDEDLNKKLRAVQAKLIAKSEKSVSFSKMINDLLRKSLK